MTTTTRTPPRRCATVRSPRRSARHAPSPRRPPEEPPMAPPSTVSKACWPTSRPSPATRSSPPSLPTAPSPSSPAPPPSSKRPSTSWPSPSPVPSKRTRNQACREQDQSLATSENKNLRLDAHSSLPACRFSGPAGAIDAADWRAVGRCISSDVKKYRFRGRPRNLGLRFERQAGDSEEGGLGFFPFDARVFDPEARIAALAPVRHFFHIEQLKPEIEAAHRIVFFDVARQFVPEGV